MMLLNTILFASTASATCLHGLSMFKRATDEVQVSTFGYGPLNGPFNWASLAPENEACNSGMNQSPINLDGSVTLATDRPVVSIPTVDEVIFENLGTTLEVIANGTTSFAGVDYQLAQFHMHTPSEHHIDGEYHPLEIHMVHQGVADPTQLVVIGLMFQVSAGNSSSMISSLSSALPEIATPGTKTAIKGGIDFSDVLSVIKTSDIVQYSGSLTTPPCAEGVTFLIVKDPLDISVADFNAIKKIVKFNARFIQNELGSANILSIGAVAGTPEAQMPASDSAMTARLEISAAIHARGQPENGTNPWWKGPIQARSQPENGTNPWWKGPIQARSQPENGTNPWWKGPIQARSQPENGTNPFWKGPIQARSQPENATNPFWAPPVHTRSHPENGTNPFWKGPIPAAAPVHARGHAENGTNPFWKGPVQARSENASNPFWKGPETLPRDLPVKTPKLPELPELPVVGDLSKRTENSDVKRRVPKY